MMTQKNRYPSDVTNTQWLFIQQLLHAAEHGKSADRLKGRRRSTELRSVINAINYRWKTGCTWRMLPHDFPKWETVYTYFRQWRDLGMLPALREVMIMKKYPKAKMDRRSDSDSKIPSSVDKEVLKLKGIGITAGNNVNKIRVQSEEPVWPVRDLPSNEVTRESHAGSNFDHDFQEVVKLNPENTGGISFQ